MRVAPYTPAGYNPYSAYNSSTPRPKMVKPIKPEAQIGEPNYGKGMKQLSYVIGMSILGVSSIILGTRGKICSSIKL